MFFEHFPPGSENAFCIHPAHFQLAPEFWLDVWPNLNILQASVPRGFQAVASNDNAKSFLDHGVPRVLLLCVVYFLLGRLKADRAKGRDQAWRSPELGCELEFNQVPRNVAGAAQRG